MLRSLAFQVLITFNLFAVEQCSEIVFQSTPTDFKTGLTKNLKLRCELKDTAASSGVIGRRDVTLTQDNMAEVTSIVLMRNGQDVASVGHTHPARLLDTSLNGTAVAGAVSQRGFLELNIPYPDVSTAGEFVCQINALDANGDHAVTFARSVEVTASDPSMADLVAVIRTMRVNEDNLKTKLDSCGCGSKSVFFSAKINKDVNARHANQSHVIYDSIFTNVGNGYNSTTGLFTCPVSGYYRFSISAMTTVQFDLDLMQEFPNKSKQLLISIQEKGTEIASNSVIVHVTKGDLVYVLMWGNNKLVGFQGHTLFSGELIHAD